MGEFWLVPLCAVFAGLVAAAFAAVIFVFSHRVLRLEFGAETRDLAAAAVRLLGVLHALLLGLLFADAQVEYSRIRREVENEATTLSNLVNDLNWYGGSEAGDIRELVKRYTRDLIDTEWALLGDDRLSEQASALAFEIKGRILDLDTADPRQERLQATMLSEVTKLADIRHDRFYDSRDRLPSMFWIMMFSGFAIICFLFVVYSFTWINLIIMSLFPFFFGVVSFMLFAFSDPFDSYLGVSPRPLEVFYNTVIDGKPIPGKPRGHFLFPGKRGAFLLSPGGTESPGDEARTVGWNDRTRIPTHDAATDAWVYPISGAPFERVRVARRARPVTA